MPTDTTAADVAAEYLGLDLSDNDETNRFLIGVAAAFRANERGQVEDFPHDAALDARVFMVKTFEDHEVIAIWANLCPTTVATGDVGVVDFARDDLHRLIDQRAEAVQEDIIDTWWDRD